MLFVSSVSNSLSNYGRRHFKLFTNCHVSWDTLYLTKHWNLYFLFLSLHCIVLSIISSTTKQYNLCTSVHFTSRFTNKYPKPELFSYNQVCYSCTPLLLVSIDISKLYNLWNLYTVLLVSEQYAVVQCSVNQSYHEQLRNIREHSLINLSINQSIDQSINQLKFKLPSIIIKVVQFFNKK